MEQTNSFRTLLYIVVGLVIVVGAVVLLTKHKAPAGDNMVIGQANVSEINVVKSDSFPVGVNVEAKGTLPDSCTTLGDVKQTYAAGVFSVVVQSKKPQSAQMCAETVSNFDQTIALTGVSGLPKGTYTIDVNGVKGAFTLSVDNFISATDPLK